MDLPHPSPPQPILWRVLGCFLVCSATTLAEPIQRIFDSAHMLSPANHAELAQELEEFSAATGCQVFVKAETYLESGITARTAARRARRELVATGPVVLFLSDRAKDSIAISQSPDLWQRYPMTHLVENLRTAMTQAQTPNISPEQRLTGCIKAWLQGIRRLEVERQAKQQVIPPSQRPITAVYASLLGLGTLAAILLGRRDRQSLAVEQQQTLFPEIEVGQRLGGPHGGGVIAILAATGSPHQEN